MDSSEILSLGSICFVGMVSPGPDFLLLARNSLAYPRAQALATAFGIIAGCAFHSSYCLFGLALIVSKSVLVYQSIKYLGAAYLLYLGVKCLRAKSSSLAASERSAEETSRELSISQAFTQGLLCNLLNPKLAVFLLSLFTQFLSPDAGLFERAICVGIFFAQALIYWPLLALGLARPVLRAQYARLEPALNICFGLLIIACALKVALAA